MKRKPLYHIILQANRVTEDGCLGEKVGELALTACYSPTEMERAMDTIETTEAFKQGKEFMSQFWVHGVIFNVYQRLV